MTGRAAGGQPFAEGLGDHVDVADAVSRESAARSAAGDVFGTALPAADAYAELLATDGVAFGLIGPRELDRLWSRHLLNCAVVAELVGAGESVVDVGSGAGLPGIPIALARPEASVTLIEPLERRARFLVRAVDRLELADRVRVVRDRAESVTLERGAFDVVTARAVAPVKTLVGWTVPLARPGGRVLALKGARLDAELADAARELRRAGVREWRIREVGVGVTTPPTRLLELRVSSRPRASGHESGTGARPGQDTRRRPSARGRGRQDGVARGAGEHRG